MGGFIVLSNHSTAQAPSIIDDIFTRNDKKRADFISTIHEKYLSLLFI